MPHISADKSPRLMVKQHSTAKNPHTYKERRKKEKKRIKLLHSKRNYKQGEKATLRMGEINSK